MATYNIILDNKNILRISFGESAHNDQIVKDAAMCLEQMIQTGEIMGGEIIRINGPASLPVAMTIAHGLSHLYQAIAVYDPKLSKYVVAIAHGSKYKLGDLVE